MVVYKILDTELGRVMLGAVGGKLAFCHFVLPSLEAVLERVAADFPGALIVPVGEQHTGAEMCPNAVKFVVGEQSGTVVCPEARNVPVGREYFAVLHGSFLWKICCAAGGVSSDGRICM